MFLLLTQNNVDRLTVLVVFTIFLMETQSFLEFQGLLVSMVKQYQTQFSATEIMEYGAIYWRRRRRLSTKIFL